MTQAKTEPGKELVKHEPGHLTDLGRLGTWLALAEENDQSERGRGAAAALRLYWAEQMGLAPMAANDIPLIKGRPYVQANVARALAHRAGYVVRKENASADSVTAVISRGGEELGRETFTMEQARKAGIVRDKSPWQTYPERMLWAKAARFVIADHAPEVLLGIGEAEAMGEIIDADYEELHDDEPEPAGADKAVEEAAA